MNSKKLEVEKNLELCNENYNKATDDNNMLHNDLCRAMNEIREYKKKLGEYKKYRLLNLQYIYIHNKLLY